MADSIENIIKKTLSGISKAQKDFESQSDYWLDEAPESMIRTYIAKEIAQKCSLMQEARVREIIDKANGLGPGRTRKNTRLGGNVDIVVYQTDGKPKAIIEVKKVNIEYGGFSNIKPDVERIIGLLKRSKKIIQCGLVAYYTECEGDKAAEKCRNKVEAIKCGAYTHIKKNGLNLRQYPKDPKPRLVDDSAWIAVVLEISK